MKNKPFTYDGNDNETYYIFQGNKKVAEIFEADDVVAHMVQILNASNINNSIECFRNIETQ